MSYNQLLASRIETVLADLEPPKLVSKKMFGGICWITQGNIAYGVLQDKLIIRVGKHAYQEALEKPGTAPLDVTKRPMTGWVFVEPPETESDEELYAWVRQGIEFALSLPQKLMAISFFTDMTRVSDLVNFSPHVTLLSML